MTAGTVPSDQVIAEAKSVGISQATLKRAKSKRRGTDQEIMSRRESSGNDGAGHWVWEPARTRAGHDSVIPLPNQYPLDGYI